MNKKILISSLALIGLVTAGIVGVKTVRADDNSFYPPFIAKLAERFNLNQDELKNFFDEQHQERLQQMHKQHEQRLNQAVTDGVITEEQKQAILAKHEEMQNQQQQHHQEMQAWFETQGIDPEKLAPYVGFGMRGFGKMHAFHKFDH